jgi:ribose 1,5-bisphosphokinase
MDAPAFRRALADGRFAVDWEAHGHSYGLPRAIDDDIRAGRAVVVNVSRSVIGALRRLYENVVVVTITAPADILAARLATRGRSSDADLGKRLHRVVDAVAQAADVTIVNVGDAVEHAKLLTRIVRGEPGLRHDVNSDRGGNADGDHHHD